MVGMFTKYSTIKMKLRLLKGFFESDGSIPCHQTGIKIKYKYITLLARKIIKYDSISHYYTPLLYFRARSNRRR